MPFTKKAGLLCTNSDPVCPYAHTVFTLCSQNPLGRQLFSSLDSLPPSRKMANPTILNLLTLSKPNYLLETCITGWPLQP